MIMKRKTTEEFIEQAKAVHGDKYDYSKVEYTNKYGKVIIICPEHGEFLQSAEAHYNGQGCPKCGRMQAGKSKRLTVNEMLQRCKAVHGSYYDYDFSTTEKGRDNIKIYCKIHGWFTQSFYHHINGCGCTKCGYEKLGRYFRSNTQDFIKKAKNVHGFEYDYTKTEYINNTTPVTITCKKHGDFLQAPYTHLVGSGCPKCSLRSQSNLQKQICKKLPDLELVWEASPEWLGKMRFDLYSEKYNFEIEHHGIQHYQPIELFGGEKEFKKRLEADALKTKLCEENGCKQFIIKYDYTEKDIDDLIENIKKIIDNYEN